ncbi:thiolase family protein [Mycobacterium timonense]|uniref:Acetyl-CoA acetyltransferase n=1 Tax=Mycobacterium bouchedurhonense TaxID=701041 RepID=A0AAW5SAY0_MYCBC|nr:MULTISPECIES: thiolase family protein [Mycobacterium avium complex (MAC)]MCV6991663.1 thiolase family protein [Mycobacterium bouchedurhonense]MCV6998355.1 thiolase family protein [Mycobacterium timonense]ORA47436.1 acetyl-CoA acetyltransferase [Mycobacterium bouchedurhonense]
MRTESAVIIDAVRSPMGKGKPGGALSSMHAVELLAQVLQGLMGRQDLDPALVDDVLIGCVSQAADQAATPGRWAWLAAGLPEHVPAVTIDRRCGSSQQALHFAAQGVIAGEYDVVVAGGIESMSRVPMGSARMGVDPFGPAHDRYLPGLVSQGISAELVAAKWKLTREQLDEYAARSHARAAAVAAAGEFANEIVPITVGDGVVCADETIRPSTTVERLSTLPPSFEQEAMSRRFPQIQWHITAGNSSQLADGASAVLVTSERRAEELGLRPRARFHAFALACDDPITMLSAPIPATRKVLQRAGLRASEIDHFEVNEAFASVPLAWQAELDVDPNLLNPRGGAIAFGHPLGASGARLMATMLGALEATSGRYGLQTMCEGGGMANATIIERL